MFSFKFHGADNTPITFHLSKDSKKILYLYSYMQRVADISGFARCGLADGYLFTMLSAFTIYGSEKDREEG